MLSPRLEAQAEQWMTYDTFTPPDVETLMSVKERFVFNVRYGVFNLGEIEVELLNDTTYQGETVQHMRTVMRTTRRVPFMSERNVHYHNLFTYDREALYSHRFWRDDLHDNEPERTVIEFDREREEVRFFERGEPEDTLELVEPASGGDVIFYYARQFAGIEQPFELPVFISGDLGKVSGQSGHQTEMRSYDAFDQDIPTYMTEGVADIDGPFGFTGRYRAWFAADDLRIPVEARVRVLFGNVRINLISYEQIED
jgi:hypothetical protein